MEAASLTNVRFHAELVSSCSNRHLLELIRAGRQAGQRYEYAFLQEVLETQASAEQHEEIIAALERQEMEAAVDKLAANWNRTIEVLVQCLKQE